MKGCTAKGAQSFTVDCFGNVTSFALFGGASCGGAAVFQGSSTNGACKDVPTLSSSYVVFCGDAPTPSSSPSATSSRSLSPTASPAPSASPQWQEFRGNAAHTGRSAYVGSQAGALKWSHTMSVGSNPAILGSSPVVAADGTVYTYNYALNGTTGALFWQTAQSVSGTPAITASGAVIFACQDKVVAVRGDSGALIWSQGPFTLCGASPVMNKAGTIFLATQDQITLVMSMTAFNNVTGEVLWQFPLDALVYSSAAVDPVQDAIYFGCDDGKLYSLSASKGELLWAFTTGGKVQSSPLVAGDGSIYFGAADNNMYSVSRGGKLQWVYNTGGAVVSSAALDTDLSLYFGSGDGNVYAVKAASGAIKWIYPTGAAGGILSSPAVGRDGTVYVGGAETKDMLALEGATGRVKWSAHLPLSILQSPAIAQDGSVLVGSVPDHSTARVYSFK